MITSVGNRAVLLVPRPSPIRLSVLCGISVVRQSVVEALADLDFHDDPEAPIKLVLDLPRSYAQRTLEDMDRQDLKLILVTWNPCPEYMDDLWDLQPDGLLTGEITSMQDWRAAINEALEYLYRGERYRLTPGHKSVLTARERAVLRCAAWGGDNKSIAEQLTIQPQSAKNALRRVYKKLNIHNHAQAALYYRGVWES